MIGGRLAVVNGSVLRPLHQPNSALAVRFSVVAFSMGNDLMVVSLKTPTVQVLDISIDFVVSSTLLRVSAKSV